MLSLRNSVKAAGIALRVVYVSDNLRVVFPQEGNERDQGVSTET